VEPPFDPSLLPTFLAVLDHGRISGAARAVHLSQPAVTARIQRLEDSLGTPLLTRSVRGVAPTAAGLRIAQCGRDLQRLLDEAVAEIAGTSQNSGSLELMASTTVAAHVLPPLLARFQRHHPQVLLRLDVGNTEDVVEAVRSGTVALGLVEGHRRMAGVRLEPWLDDELVPVIGPDAPWRLRGARDLVDVPILWREPGSGTRAVVAKALRQAGQRSRPGPRDLVLGTSEAIASGAAAGLGVAFLSRWALGPYLASSRLRPVPGLDLVVRRVFSWALPTAAPGGIAGQFLAFARLQTLAPA